MPRFATIRGRVPPWLVSVSYLLRLVHPLLLALFCQTEEIEQQGFACRLANWLAHSD